MVSKYEIKAQHELELDSWRVDNKRGASRWTKNRDFWNLFDLVAIKPKISYVRWISVKGRAGVPSAHLKEIKEFKFPKGNIKEIWSRSTSRKKGHYWNKATVG